MSVNIGEYWMFDGSLEGYPQKTIWKVVPYVEDHRNQDIKSAKYDICVMAVWASVLSEDITIGGIYGYHSTLDEGDLWFQLTEEEVAFYVLGGIEE